MTPLLSPVERKEIEAIDTPAVIVDLDRVDANIGAFQSYCDAHRIRNRPHIKTHKLPQIALRQIAAGAAGITVQTLGEAEVMAAAGIDDILITYNLIGPAKAERLARLAGDLRVRVAVDNDVALGTVAQAGSWAGRQIEVLIEFESGKERQGVVTADEALRLARRAANDPHLSFAGLMTYPSSPQVETFVARARERFAAEGLEIGEVSVGGTPGMWRAHELSAVTEYRAGTYVYHDRKTVQQGSAALEDCALHVHATLVSRPTRDRGVLDAGSKILTSDRVPPEMGEGYGLILEYPDAVIRELSEEHAVVDFRGCEEPPIIGERLRVVPNHVCPVSNLVDEVVLHRNGIAEAIVPVAARGKR